MRLLMYSVWFGSFNLRISWCFYRGWNVIFTPENSNATCYASWCTLASDFDPLLCTSRAWNSGSVHCMSLFGSIKYVKVLILWGSAGKILYWLTPANIPLMLSWLQSASESFLTQPEIHFVNFGSFFFSSLALVSSFANSSWLTMS